VIPLTSIFQATQDLLQELEKMAIRFVQRTDRSVTQANGRVQINFFSSRRSITQALMASATGLQKRIHGVLNLVRDPSHGSVSGETDVRKLADTLILKHQRESAKTNGYLVHLTKDTVDDSATVRVVTLVTLIYLPASFIAVGSSFRFSCRWPLTISCRPSLG